MKSIVVYHEYVFGRSKDERIFSVALSVLDNESRPSSSQTMINHK